MAVLLLGVLDDAQTLCAQVRADPGDVEECIILEVATEWLGGRLYAALALLLFLLQYE